MLSLGWLVLTQVEGVCTSPIGCNHFGLDGLVASTKMSMSYSFSPKSVALTYPVSFDLDYPIDCDDDYLGRTDRVQPFKQPTYKHSAASFFIWVLKLSHIIGFTLRTIVSRLKCVLQDVCLPGLLFSTLILALKLCVNWLVHSGENTYSRSSRLRRRNGSQVCPITVRP